MTYIDAIHDRKKNRIHVIERDGDLRYSRSYPAEYSFYYPDKNGEYTSLHGYPLRKFQTTDSKKFRQELEQHRPDGIHEGDIKPLFKCLEQNYLDSPLPDLRTGGVDIETAFCKERGYASPDDPHQPVTSITFSYDWEDRLITLAVVPPSMKSIFDEAEEICNKFDDTYLFHTEADMLDAFLDLIDPIDVLYTWNGEGFDIPYLVNRITLVLGSDYLKKMCLLDQMPQKRTFERFGKENVTYDLVGRLHLDYLQLYKKYTYHEMHSYKLDSIAEYELGEKKTEFDGTLDELYNNHFELFITYNRQDVNLIRRLENKLRFIQLTNQLAHDNCVTLPTTMGSVQIIDQAITIYAHKQGFKVPNGKRSDSDIAIAGAYVADPEPGLYEWVASVDINSLYPSTIRMLNMSTETIVGQLRPTLTEAHVVNCLKNKMTATDAWNNIFGSLEYLKVIERCPDTWLTVDFDDGQSHEMTASQVYDWIFSNNDYCLSANGTIFNNQKSGIIPQVLADWYSGRKQMQAKAKQFEKAYQEETDPDKRKELELEFKFYDQRQLARKILLNSLYGALTNIGSRFCDKRIGQSTTLTGRQITKHMLSKINETLLGDYSHNGESIKYGDSVTGDSLIRINDGTQIRIDDLYESLKKKVITLNGKEYAVITDERNSKGEPIQVLGYNSRMDQAEFGNIFYVMKHNTTKQKWQIETEDGKSVIVTNDHSIIIDRSGSIIEVKPSEILDNDLLIEFIDEVKVTKNVQRVKIKLVVCLGNFQDEPVYDIAMDMEDHFFFANDILVHNTDSGYFTLKPCESEFKKQGMEINKELLVELSDQIAEQVNDSFSSFCQQAFNATEENAKVIKCGREICGRRALFVKKKRYAVLYFDKEGIRVDSEENEGKLKIMGMETQRSDTSAFMQKILKQILRKVLEGDSEKQVIDFIRQARNEIKQVESWEKGTPKSVNKLTYYKSKLASGKSGMVPGHVMAALNWNKLKAANCDYVSLDIVDGQKVVVCKLKENPFKMKSIAYPVDQERLPLWFKELPFDDALMEQGIIDTKIDNLIGVLGWNLQKSRMSSAMSNLFKMEE